MKPIFVKLLDNGVVSPGAFKKWQMSDDPLELGGKGNFVFYSVLKM